MGHAAETIKKVARYLACVIEVADARAPEVTRYSGVRRWIGARPLLLVLNKADLADPLVTARWLRWYQGRGQVAVAVQATLPAHRAKVLAALNQLGVVKEPRRVAVLGLPNLGKSTLLNHLLGRNRLHTGNRPGITRGPQWIREAGWEWLDLPGVVSHGQAKDWRLKVLGAVGYPPDESESLAHTLWERCAGTAPGEADPVDIYGRQHGLLQKGGGVDRQRAADSIIGAFQSGKLGRISLEEPSDGR